MIDAKDEDAVKIDIAWADQHLTNFGKYRRQVEYVKRSEEEYRRLIQPAPPYIMGTP